MVLRDHFENSCLSPQKVHQLRVQRTEVAVHNQPYQVRSHALEGSRAEKLLWQLGNSFKLETLSWHRSGRKVRIPCPARTWREKELTNKT